MQIFSVQLTCGLRLIESRQGNKKHDDDLEFKSINAFCQSKESIMGYQRTSQLWTLICRERLMVAENR
jgi:hypothetical protein